MKNISERSTEGKHKKNGLKGKAYHILDRKIQYHKKINAP